MIIFIFILSIGLKTLQILGLESHKKGGELGGKEWGVWKALLCNFLAGLFFYQHFAVYGPGDWAAAGGWRRVHAGRKFFRQVAREVSD